MLAALFPTLGPLEMVLLLVVILIFFGVGKLPEVGKALGQSLRSFKDAQRGDAIDVTTMMASEVPTARCMRCASGTPSRPST